MEVFRNELSKMCVFVIQFLILSSTVYVPNFQSSIRKSFTL